jgi:hypothetical protein
MRRPASPEQDRCRHVNNIAASERQQQGKLAGKPSIGGHAKLIADFINGIGQNRKSTAK